MKEHSLFNVTIANVAGSLFDGDAVSISVPSVLGDTQILAHHEPLIALLKKGVVTVEDAHSEKLIFNIERGILEVSGNKAIVLL
jgi:F0F1-type ATP synthase epsilon subunit